MRGAPLRAALAGALLLCSSSCHDPAPAPLSILSVTPSQASTSEPVPVVIAGQGMEPRVWTDFRRGSGSSLDAGFSARLISQADASIAVELVQVSFNADQTLSATIPAGAERGQYDLQVTDPRGQTASLPQAFRVVTSAEDVADFRIEITGEPRVAVPFVVALTAVDSQGRTVDGYDGTVTLSDETGTVAPGSAGPFVLGRAQIQVSIGAVVAEDRLTVSDALGHASASDPFAVGTGLAVKIAFASAPLTASAGACSGPVDLELQDDAELPAPAGAALAIALAGGVDDGLSFFADADCASAIDELEIAAGQTRASFRFLTPRAGAPTVRATPATLPSATQAETVEPLAATRLAFTSAPQAVKAGDCSAPAVLQAQDALGNPSPVPAAVTVDLGATPAAGLTFYGDGACGPGATSVALAAGQSEASFTFKAVTAGDYRLDALARAPSALSSAAQDESIAP